mmetsp:Transcript_24255/g.34713  ORF Transcript_24255/g.34713 Transcript_24255/m.34713 type:complete len:558 (+) Transcript_24255:215-1888(+)
MNKGQTNYQSIRTATPTPSPPPTNMHQPQHLLNENNIAPAPAEAADPAHPSRQLFYRQADRIPDLSLDSRNNSRLFGATSSESSVGGSDVAQSQSEQHQAEIAIPTASGLPSPEQLHADYSYRLHRAHVRAGHRNIVVGGTHGRYRDFNGTLIEVPEEVFAVRKSALAVFYPLTFCWLILTIGFSVAAGLGAARWTNKLSSLPYWAIFLPIWISHGGIFIMHTLSAMALSKFIHEANENRQRPDSTDHLDRVEYLSLLQRSIKFGAKTGVLCFIVFIFEVLLYIRLVNSSTITLAEVFIPLWILTIIYIANGIVCKSQHLLQWLVWVLFFAVMLLWVIRVDYQLTGLVPASFIIALIIAILVIVTGVLIYVVYGHQIGYFQLTDSQLTAGVLYSMSSMLAIVVVAIMGGALHLPEIIQLDLFMITIFLAPVVVLLAGLGAYSVTRDEFDRLLKFGGQSSNTPMKLRLETNGWNSVVGNGVAQIPMFGDVRYKPLDADMKEMLSVDLFWLCCCSHFYSTEEEDEINYFGRPIVGYQSPTSTTPMSATTQWGGTEEAII